MSYEQNDIMNEEVSEDSIDEFDYNLKLEDDVNE